MNRTNRQKLRGEKPATPAADGISRKNVIEMLKRPTPYIVDVSGFWLERKRQHKKAA